MTKQSDKFSPSALSSVGRAAIPEEVEQSVQTELSPVGPKKSVSKEEGVAVMTRNPTDENTMNRDGSLDETLRVGGSNPSALANSLEDNYPTFTPRWLADDMVQLADIRTWTTVLEPSAGRGVIVEAIHRVPHGNVFCIELCEDFVPILRNLNPAMVQHADFLELEVGPLRSIDRVVMNPPGKRTDAHVIHAADMLKRGGRLVALLHEAAVSRVRLQLSDLREYQLPQYTFRWPSGEPAIASVIVWDKP